MQEILEAATIAKHYLVLLSKKFIFSVARFMGISFPVQIPTVGPG